MSDVRTYASDRVAVTFGVHSLKGMADGITSQAGADGEVARSMSADKRCKVTVTLQQTSQSNTVLSALHDADIASGGGAPLPLLIKDLRGDTLFMASAAWIVKKPNSEFGKEAGSREWVFETAKAVYSVGGN